MITIRIEIPHGITNVMTPKMLMGNYVEHDPRVQQIQNDKVNGLCTVQVSTDIDWGNETSTILINATYHSREQELLTLLSL